jgi:tetratricopeptide (TPR) repeat protein
MIKYPVLLLLSLTTAAFAQGSQQQQPPQQQPKAQQQAQPATPQQQGQVPQQQAQPGQQVQPGTANPAAPAHHAPQAKTQDEYAAYQQAIQQQDPDACAKAVDEFAVKYPQSELRAPLYQELTRRYFTANKADQVLLYGRKTLDLEPNNPLALAMIARVLAERTQESDIDRDERLNEAIKDAEKMIATIDQSLPDIIPPNVSPDQAENVKKQLLFMAWDAEGKAEMELKQDTKAQQSFEKALQYAPEEARTRFRLALTLDREGKYPEALGAVNQAIQGSTDDPALMQQAQAEKSRLQQLTGAAPGGASSSNAATPPNGAPPQSGASSPAATGAPGKPPLN